MSPHSPQARTARTTGPAGPARPSLDAPGDAGLSARLLVAAGLVAITLAAFWSALGHDFVGMDDADYVSTNAALMARHYGDLLLAVVAGNFHPLSLITMAWNVGTPLSARPFIATNLALHVANTLLVFTLVWRLSNRRLFVAAFVALLFGIHPMHVESVVWVSERKDVLYAFFLLSAAIAYGRYLDRRAWPLLAITFVLFVLACFAKAMAVVFPGVMLLLDYWNRRPVLERRAMVEKLPFLAVSVLFGLIAVDAQRGGDFHGLLHLIGVRSTALEASQGLGLWQRLTLPTHSVLTYIARVFAPLRLTGFEPYPSAEEMARLDYALAPFVFLALVALAMRDVRRTRVIAFGLGWFMVTIALVLQWIPVGGAIVADRYSYLSYIGLFFILGMGIQAVFERRRALGTALWGAAAAFAIALFCLTIPQVATWRDPEALWERMLTVHPGEAWIHSVRGLARASKGRMQPALDDFRVAYGLGLRTVDLYQGLGSAYGATGKLDSSLIMLDRGLALEPSRGGLYYNRAATYQALGRQREALADMDRVAALMPERVPKLHGARATAFMALGEYAAADSELTRAIVVDGESSELLYARGTCRLKLGDRAGAADDFRAMLRVAPGDARARAELQALGH